MEFVFIAIVIAISSYLYILLDIGIIYENKFAWWILLQLIQWPIALCLLFINHSNTIDYLMLDLVPLIIWIVRRKVGT